MNRSTKRHSKLAITYSQAAKQFHSCQTKNPGLVPAWITHLMSTWPPTTRITMRRKSFKSSRGINWCIKTTMSIWSHKPIGINFRKSWTSRFLVMTRNTLMWSRSIVRNHLRSLIKSSSKRHRPPPSLRSWWMIGRLRTREETTSNSKTCWLGTSPTRSFERSIGQSCKKKGIASLNSSCRTSSTETLHGQTKKSNSLATYSH